MLTGLSIKRKLLIPVILIFLITTAQIYLVINMNRAQQEDTSRVNVAGRQRMLSQKMTKETFHFLNTRDTAHAKAQGDTIAVFEKSLKALLIGGELDLSGRSLLIKPTANKEILAALNEAEQYWQKSKPVYLQAVQQSPGSQTVEANQINEISLQLLKHFDNITGMYEIASMATVKRNMAFIYAGLGFLMLTAFTAWYYINKAFVQPILGLSHSASRIASGDLSQ